MPGPRGGQSEAGFTLIEALVALAILAVSAISLLAATQAHVARIAGLEARALAQFAAENHLAEMGLGLAGVEGSGDILGHDLEIAARLTPTDDPDLARVDVAVTDAERGETFGGFVGFLDTGVPETGRAP